MRGKGTSGGGNLGQARAMQQGDRQIATSGENLRRVGGAKTGAVFLEGDIADVMRTVFDAPMATDESQKLERRGKLRREISDEIDDLGGGHALLGDGARHFSDLGNVWPAGGEIGIHFATYPNNPMLHAPPATIPGLSRLAGRLGVGKGDGEVSMQCGLILLDREDALATVVVDQLHERGVSMQGISGRDRSGEGEG